MLTSSAAIKAISKAGYVIGLYFLLYVVSAGSALADGISKAPLQKFSHVEKFLQEAAGSETPGDRITSISSHFLGIPYVANSLIGGPAESEQLVTRLDGFDCFTFLDTVEALRRSTGADDLSIQMRQVRYRAGVVSYKNRRHFFSDWVTDDGSPIKDVTAMVGQGRQRRSPKKLNMREDGTLWVDGVDVRPRMVAYIPAGVLDAKILDALDSGDYVGVFSPRPGLDVSHAGLIVKTDSAIMLRHASSRGGVDRIIDEDLMTYMRGKTGLIVYRVMQ